MNINDVYTFSEAAKIYGIHSTTIIKKKDNGAFSENEVKKSGGTWLITKEAMERAFKAELESKRILFNAAYTFEDNDKQVWDGIVDNYKDYGHSFQAEVKARGSSLLMVVAEYSAGWAIFIPEYNTGAKLATLDDDFYNFESVVRAIGNPIDAMSVTKALKAICQEFNWKERSIKSSAEDIERMILKCGFKKC